MTIQINRYGYPYFHRNWAEYGRLWSEIARKRTVFILNTGHEQMEYPFLLNDYVCEHSSHVRHFFIVIRVNSTDKP